MSTKLDHIWSSRFCEQLDCHYNWPAWYTFKFVVPSERSAEFKKLFPNHQYSERVSKKEMYIGITYDMMMSSSQAVVNVYRTAAKIPGIIAL